jgi:hypothetical protein
MSGADLVAFLNARLDEDEARALKAREEWDTDHVRYEWEDLPDEVFAHARTHDPGRVLREVEAKRFILAEYEKAESDYGEFDVIRITHLRRAVKALAGDVPLDKPTDDHRKY